MSEWYEDLWLNAAANMAEEFYRRHRANLPEDPHNVWKEREVSAFCFAHVLWSMKTQNPRLARERKSELDARITLYRKNVRASYEGMESEANEVTPGELLSFDVYLQREAEYVQTLMMGAGNILRVLTGTTVKPACGIFVGHACKRYIFKFGDLVGYLSPWVIDKYIEHQKTLKIFA